MPSASKPSLRWVLTLSYTVLLVIGLLALGGGVFYLVGRHQIRTGEARLVRMVVDGLRSERMGPPGQLPRDWEPRRLARAIAEPRSFVQVYVDDRLVARVDPRRGDPLPEVRGLTPSRRPGGSLITRLGERRWQVAAVPLQRANQTVATVVVGLPWDASQELLNALARYFLLIGAGTALVTLLVSRWLAARLTRPLEQLSAAADRVSEGDLAARAPEHPGTREEQRLFAAFDAMVARLESALAQQRRFVADASHELRTPLTAIGGMVEMLARGADQDPEDRRLALSTAEREIERMARLVDDLLTLSRAEQRPPAPEVIRLQPFLEELAGYAGLLQREVTVDCPADLTVTAPREPLSRALRNLVDNAVKYSSEPIRLVGRPGEIVVEDRGIGIPAEELPHVFERFYRSDPARARGTGGTGLGLAIVRALTESMGGTVRLESAPGRGTRAILNL